MKKTPVLMYHEVTDRDIARIPIEERPYAITPTTFDEHLAYLDQQGIASRPVNAERPDEGHSVVITFDDGFASDARTALPRLLSHGLNAEFYITTGWIGKPGYVTESDILALSEAGMVIGTHGVNHRFFDDLSEEDLRLELRESKSALENIIGQQVVCGSAPGGRIHPKTQQIASEIGYQYLCVSDARLADLTPTDRFRFIPRFAMKRDMPLEQFAKLASGDKRAVALNSAKTTTLALAKYVLGNRNYERIRHRLLSSREVN